MDRASDLIGVRGYYGGMRFYTSSRGPDTRRLSCFVFGARGDSHSLSMAREARMQNLAPGAVCKSCGRPQTSFAYWMILFGERICDVCYDHWKDIIDLTPDDNGPECRHRGARMQAPVEHVGGGTCAAGSSPTPPARG